MESGSVVASLGTLEVLERGCRLAAVECHQSERVIAPRKPRLEHG